MHALVAWRRVARLLDPRASGARVGRERRPGSPRAASPTRSTTRPRASSPRPAGRPDPRDHGDQCLEPHRDHRADGAWPLPPGLCARDLGRRRNTLCRLVALAGAVKRRVGREPLGDAHDLAAERPELQLDCRVPDLTVLVEDSRRRRNGNDVRDGPPRSARVANSIVLMACRPCVPPAALISPITSSCRNAGSRPPSTCSQSSAF